MNLYILTYERWDRWESTTSDGFPDVMADWKKKEQDFEAESDEAAREQAHKLLTGAVQSEQKIQLPVLTRVVTLPKVDGVKTYKDLQPWLEYAHYYQEEGVASV